MDKDKKKLTRQEVVVRTLIMMALVAVVSWFVPRNETFRYEYEVGKPWRYGRLSAPYDFAVYRSDSIVRHMEDSLRRRLTPRFVCDPEVGRQRLGDAGQIGASIPAAAYRHLTELLTDFYGRGVMTTTDMEALRRGGHAQVMVRTDNESIAVAADSLLTDKAAFERLLTDTAFSALHSRLNLRSFVQPNLSADTATMNREYAVLRQNLSAASGVVLAESRIIDKGEIVTPELYDVLNSYRREQAKRQALTGDHTLMAVGTLVLVLLIMVGVLLFLRIYRPWIHLSQSETLMAVGLMAVMVILTSLATRYISSVAGVWLVPIGLVTVALSTFQDSRTAFFCHVVMTILCALIAPQPFEYVIIQTLVGMAIIFVLNDGLTERSQLMHVCLVALVTYVFSYLIFTLAQQGSLKNIAWVTLTMMLINSLLLLMSYLVVYALEKTFGFMSGVTLVELCNLSNKLLTRLSQQAPGTFQHSLQVGNLTAAAAKEIGANPQLVRTGALYHDIGKLWNPVYYTENQQGANPHDQLPLEESVAIIRRHVTEGVRMAQKANLPDDIVQFIRTHHGRSLIKYFYTTWCNAHPGEEPDTELFSYAGPDPETREQALLMMGDSVEAASKSLKEYNEESLTRLVDGIVDGMVAAGRFHNADITLRDIQKVKQSFVRTLLTLNHSRIAYPELKKESNNP